MHDVRDDHRNRHGDIDDRGTSITIGRMMSHGRLKLRLLRLMAHTTLGSLVIG